MAVTLEICVGWTDIRFCSEIGCVEGEYLCRKLATLHQRGLTEQRAGGLYSIAGGRHMLMHMSTNQQLARMANDIGNFFRAQRREEAIAGIENHIRSFWTPRMREKLTALLASGDTGLDELPAEALCRINHNKDQKPLQSAGGDAG
jgi:formate dehydrogenase subunit delta